MINISPIIASSGMSVTPHRNCPDLKKGKWFAIPRSMTGDAPKDFLAVYEYSAAGCRCTDLKTWPRFIAKVGHKWYPNESVTEHVITRIGQSLKIEIADSRLVHLRGQLRFLSRYFLNGSEYLLHGADIFATCLEDYDLEFVQGVENEGKSPEYFDYDFTVESIKAMFPDAAEAILQSFHQMIAFDALIGNNDRHFFNWGIICDQFGRRPPKFSPIFDTARALFWNHSEEGLSRIDQKGNEIAQLRKYSLGSHSKIGACGGGGRVNHFALLESIIKRNPSTADDLNILARTNVEPVELAKKYFSGEFKRLISPLRQNWICRLIDYRTQQFRRVLNGKPIDV